MDNNPYSSMPATSRRKRNDRSNTLAAQQAAALARMQTQTNASEKASQISVSGSSACTPSTAASNAPKVSSEASNYNGSDWVYSKKRSPAPPPVFPASSPAPILRAAVNPQKSSVPLEATGTFTSLDLPASIRHAETSSASQSKAVKEEPIAEIFHSDAPQAERPVREPPVKQAKPNRSSSVSANPAKNEQKQNKNVQEKVSSKNKSPEKKSLIRLPDWTRGPIVSEDDSIGKKFGLGILRRLYFAIKIIPRIALLAPILLFMVYVNYNVDRSGLFQGALAPRRIVDLMLQGYDVTNFEQMDERQVVELYAQDVPEAPTAIGIGSSRILQFTTDIVGTDSFFNMGVTGADVRDNMTSYYKMVSYGKAPQVLIWSVDPWVFYDSEDAFDSRADAELYNEFLTKVLGVSTDYEEPDQLELWKALVDPAYFQGNIDYYLKNEGQATVTDDEGNVIEFNPVEGDPYDQTTAIKRSDGSVLYDKAFRGQSEDEIRALAASACMSFNSVHMEGFDSLSETQCEAFDKFIKYAQSQGTTVILILSPWHPYLYEYLCGEPEQHQGFFQVENWVRQYCADNNIPLYGSYDPLCIEGLEEIDFFDGLHCKDSGIVKFFPGTAQVLQDLQNGTLPDPLAVTPRTGYYPETTTNESGDGTAEETTENSAEGETPAA